jgi:two-component system, NtrC family, sensor histidine kinase HydH
VLWSTRPEMVGKVLPINSELEEARNGELAVESSILEDNNYLKPEHVYLKTKEDFVETYVPIWAEDQFRVLGVIEIYRRPTALFALTHDLIRGVWLSALASAVFLFATLYWLARRANRTMHAQHRQLVDAEKLAAVGEISAAIAHSIRNPLATIRSTAELAQEIDPHTMHEPATDIVKQVDRIVFLINQLLTYAQPAGLNLTRVDAMAILREVLESFAPTLTRQHINVQAPESAPSLVEGDRTVISQVFNSLIANAIEAMPKGGNIAVSVTASSDRSRLSIIIADTGEGIPPEHRRRLFIPFNTTKKSGLGVGLPLVRSALDRMSGSIDIASTLGSGTRVQIQLPAA